MWSVPRIYTEIPRITEVVESEWELEEQSSAGSEADQNSVQCSAEQLRVQGREWSMSLANCED
jgi:hypothetical protein